MNSNCTGEYDQLIFQSELQRMANVAPQTIRKKIRDGVIVPDERTMSGQNPFRESRLNELLAAIHSQPGIPLAVAPTHPILA